MGGQISRLNGQAVAATFSHRWVKVVASSVSVSEYCLTSLSPQSWQYCDRRKPEVWTILWNSIVLTSNIFFGISHTKKGVLYRKGVLYTFLFTELPFKTVSGGVTAFHSISYYYWMIQEFLRVHSTIDSTAQSTSLNSLEHCMTKIRPGRDSSKRTYEWDRMSPWDRP